MLHDGHLGQHLSLIQLRHAGVDLHADAAQLRNPAQAASMMHIASKLWVLYQPSQLRAWNYGTICTCAHVCRAVLVACRAFPQCSNVCGASTEGTGLSKYT